MNANHHPLNSNSSVMIKWTRPLLDKFKLAYRRALEGERDMFVFEDNGYTVSYAHHLIVYLEGTL